MSKTAEEIGLILGGLALMAVPGLQAFGLIAIAGHAALLSAMLGIGVSTALSGVGLALRPTPTPVGTTNTISFGNGPAPRRVLYGQFQTAGVLTYASFPPACNLATTGQDLQLVYTLTEHEISSFDAVVIDGTVFNFGGAHSDLQYDPTDQFWHIKPQNSGTINDFYYEHIYFEFDFGRKTQGFPNLALFDPAWTSACIQSGCAKVHVQLRADSGWTALFPAGQQPNIQFLVTGKKLVDPRIVTAWQASMSYLEYNYVIDNNGTIWVQTNTSGTTGSTRPAFESHTSGWPVTLSDGSCSWTSHGASIVYAETPSSGDPQGNLLNGRLMNDSWAAGTGYPQYIVIESPIGYLQMQTAASGTSGTAVPTFATTLGGTTTDNSMSWVCLGRSRHALNPSNSALVVNDYLQDVDYGMAAPAATIDTASVIAAANVCEEQALIIMSSGTGSGFTFTQHGSFNDTLRVVNGAGVINTLVLTSSDSVYNGNGGFGTLNGIALDTQGNIYVCDSLLHCVFQVSSGGVVTRIAGTGVSGYSGDGGAATSAKMVTPWGIAVDAAGNVYFSDQSSSASVVRVINMQATTQTLLNVSVAAGDIQIVAGIHGSVGNSGNGGPAISAQLSGTLFDLAFDSSGNLYICDGTNYCIRKVTASTGVISIFAGTGTNGYNGDGGAATGAETGQPMSCCFDAAGNFYFAQENGPMVFPLTSVATGSGVYTGTINFAGSSITGSGNAFAGVNFAVAGFLTGVNNGTLMCTTSTGTTLTLNNSFSSAETHAATATLSSNATIRKVDLSGNISTICGQGPPGYAGDGGGATSARIKGLFGLFCDSTGDVYLTDTANFRIREINASTGIITTVAGTGTNGDTGDTGLATSAKISSPNGICGAVSAGGIYENLYACDGQFDHSSERGNVLTALCGSMAGWVIPPGDLWHVFAGAYLTPTVTLTDNDMRAAIKGEFRLSRREVANGIKGSYIPGFLPTNPAGALALTQVPATWSQQSFPPYQANGLAGKPDYLNSEDGGQILWQDMQLDFTKSLWMAQRLAKIALMRLRFQITITLPCKLTAFALEAGDTFVFTHARWGISSMVFEALQCSIVFDDGGGGLGAGGGQESVPSIGVDLVGRQVDPSIYEFTPPSSPTNYGEYSPFGVTGVMTGVE